MAERALDLFCGGGGVARGLMQAGFDVTGVDVEDHASAYPGRFVLGDALDLDALGLRLDDYDLIWASPPCQMFSTARFADAQKPAVNLIPQTRALLSSHPTTCIENVPRAPLRADLKLDGRMFDLPRLVRLRVFELSFWAWQPFRMKATPGFYKNISVTQSGAFPLAKRRRWREEFGRGVRVRWTRAEMLEAMGMNPDEPMSYSEIGESIPPVYARYIGMQAREAIKRVNGACRASERAND